ncbi:hypothetical protein [Actinoplanes sp. RD1]|uniref:hypothetical protein n=1 Tax=Actinoplanes sp. RD1 TaxID=3064538 RepID=UPI0027412456|nr:hypothetical protein [Actinoplanes sp. RD1]
MGEPTAAEQFVTGFARRIVAALAPDELVVFEPVSRAYLSDPGGVIDARSRPDAELGSGIDTVVLALTPVALSVATTVYEHLLGRATDLTGRRLVKAVKGLRKRRDPVPSGPVGAETLEETVAGVRQLVGVRTDDPRLADQCAEVVRALLEHHA